MPSAARLVKKEAYDKRLCGLLDTYEKAFLIGVDNVGSKQFQDIRAALRGDCEIIMGKNTMMRRSIGLYCQRNNDSSWQALANLLIGNVGILFTNGDLNKVRDALGEHRVPAAARQGALAPCDVYVYAGNTGMDPSQTSFFQALNVATKINKGTVEIVSDQLVVKEGEVVGSSEAALLAKLKITPFEYGITLQQVYDNGSMYDAAVLDITDDDVLMGFQTGCNQVAALSLAAEYPTTCSVPHSIVNSYKNVLSIAVETDYTFPLAQKVLDYLADPSAFAVAAAPAAGGGGGAGAAAAAPEPEEEEEEEDMGFDLFD